MRALLAAHPHSVRGDLVACDGTNLHTIPYHTNTTQTDRSQPYTWTPSGVHIHPHTRTSTYGTYNIPRTRISPLPPPYPRRPNLTDATLPTHHPPSPESSPILPSSASILDFEDDPAVSPKLKLFAVQIVPVTSPQEYISTTPPRRNETRGPASALLLPPSASSPVRVGQVGP